MQVICVSPSSDELHKDNARIWLVGQKSLFSSDSAESFVAQLKSVAQGSAKATPSNQFHEYAMAGISTEQIAAVVYIPPICPGPAIGRRKRTEAQSVSPPPRFLKLLTQFPKFINFTPYVWLDRALFAFNPIGCRIFNPFILKFTLPEWILKQTLRN